MDQEVMYAAFAMIASAVVGGLVTAWTTYRFQRSLLTKQIELNKEMHQQLLEEQKAFAQSMEADRRNFERHQDFVKESRDRARGS